MVFTAAEFGAYVAAESEKWAKVVQFAGFKLGKAAGDRLP
jgi:hypothetical protein